MYMVQLQHKTCSDSKADSSGLIELRDAAFAALESNVVSSANGFIDMIYESMHMVAQCGGNLEGCECGGCVNNAVQIAQDECGNSLSGEVYLDSCFISFSSNDNNGIPECGGCVNNAVQIAQDECGNSLSGEVYLDSCFISFSSNDNNGIPGNSNQGNETNQISTSSGRLVAIVVGVAAALLFVFMFFYFYRSSKRKSDDW
ncbi:plasmodesmata-located protein 2-like [Camellia sinensis]|uniref:plasmodesmata-located protein 2-like n=1 Tax=Camellia sinensis TaxID=4442 RepID=UPI001035570F|nr:plasmodesmata-located protein 2-like [Camellia sinensis]